MGEFVEIPLHSFRYRFRRLTWQDEFRIAFREGEDSRKAVLSHALANISGLPIASVEDARKVLDQMPPAIFWRIWILYRGNLPEDGYYTISSLFQAPDQKAYKKRVFEEGEAVEAVADAATRQMEQTFGPKESWEAHSLEAQLVAEAKRQGTLVRAGG
jgi:hypothetical protein